MTKVLFLIQIMTTTMMVVKMKMMEFATVTEARLITTRVRIYCHFITSLIDSANFFRYRLGRNQDADAKRAYAAAGPFGLAQ